RLHAPAIADIGHQRHDSEVRPGIAELTVNLEERRLSAVHQQQHGRVEPGDLARQLRTNRPASAGHECDTVGDEPLNLFLIEMDRIAPQEIFNLHVTNATQIDLSFQDLVHRGNDLDLDRNRFADSCNALDLVTRYLGN